MTPPNTVRTVDADSLAGRLISGLILASLIRFGTAMLPGRADYGPRAVSFVRRLGWAYLVGNGIYVGSTAAVAVYVVVMSHQWGWLLVPLALGVLQAPLILMATDILRRTAVNGVRPGVTGWFGCRLAQ